MALEWADFPSGQPGIYGTGSTGTARMLNGTPWVSTGTSGNPNGGLTDDPDPNVSAGSVCYRVTAGSNNNPFTTPGLSLALRTPTAGKVWCAGRIWFDAFSGTILENLFCFTSITGGQTGYLLRKELNGALTLVRRTGTTEETVATTTAPVLSTNAWIHLSFEINPSNGEYSVQREGDTILIGTDGSPLGMTTAFFKSMNRTTQTVQGSEAFFLKDFCVGNALGTENTGHPGSVSVFDVRPNGDTTLGGWVPSTGSTGFDLLNETPPDDARFISADDSPPAAAQFTLSNLPPDVTSIRGLISIVRARKVDGGDGNLQVGLTANGTDYANGADRPITTAFTYWSDVSEINPETTVRWTPVEVDNLQIRVDRTL